jgi:hypothetical protein
MRRTLTRGALCLGLAVLMGCGTIFYPDRRGQKPVGQVDVGVVVMNALWLLVGLVPGIVAFAVDLSTGALYHPPKSSGSSQGAALDHLGVPPGQALAFGTRGFERSREAWTVALHAEGAATPIRVWTWEGAGGLTLELPTDLASGAYEMSFHAGERRIGAFAIAVAH